MMPRLIGLALGMAAILGGAVEPAFAQARFWSVEKTESSLVFKTQQGGAPVEGRFERFDIEINFSADDLASSRVAVWIETASVNSQSSDRDEVIRSPDLFGSAAWPVARFETKRFRRVADDRFEAVADFTLRDVTREVTLPFSLEILPHPQKEGYLQAVATGEFAVRRLDYGVGQGLWRDTSVVPDEVLIRVRIVASRPFP